MQRFIAQENVKRFRRQLAQSTDERQKVVLRQLLAQAEVELASIEAYPSSGANHARVDSR